MKTTVALLVCSTALLAATPAFAQSYDDPSDLPDTPADIFSGPHVELGAGLDHIKIKSYKDTDATQDISASKTGLNYGGALGYDLPLTENWTLGAEFGLRASSDKWSNGNLVTGTFNTSQVNVGLDVSFAARLGYAMSNKTQVFGKLGFAVSHFGVTGTDGSSALYDGFSATGVRVGLGIEHQMTRHVYVKLEYDRTQYSSGSLIYSRATPDGSSFTMNNARDQLLGSVGLRF